MTESDIKDDAVITITVDKEEKTMTLGELKTLATKAAGADKVFRDASTAKKEAESALKLVEDLKHTEEDPEAFRRVGEAMGRSKDEIDDYLAGQAAQPDADDASKNKSDDDGQSAKMTPEELVELLPAEYKEAIALGQEAGLSLKRTEARADIKNLLDKDDVLGKDVITDPEVRARLEKAVEKEAVVRMAQGQKYGPGLLGEALQEVRGDAKGLGILPKPLEDVDPVAEAQKLGIGLGPDDKATIEAVQKGEAIERKPINDPDYADNLAARVLLGHDYATQEDEPTEK